MLAGDKQVAYFYSGYPEEYFQDMKKYIDDGTFESFQLESDNGLIVWAPGAKEKAFRLEELIRYAREHGYVESVEREIGKILGYSEADIDFYIDHIKHDFKE